MPTDSPESDDCHVIVETGVIPDITSVRIYDSTLHHVVVHHPEINRNVYLPSFQEAISKAIKNPSYVESNANTRSYVFVDNDTTDVRGQPLRVPVKVVSETSGRMKTAYFAEKTNPGPLLYKRNNDDT